MRLRHRPWLATTAVVVAMLLVAAPARADKETEREVRLLVLDGKFQEADALLKEDAELLASADFRATLGDLALKHIKRKEGPDRRSGLLAARGHFAAACAADPKLLDLAVAALDASNEVAQIELEAKRPTTARVHADWSATEGEKLLAAAADAGVEGLGALQMAVAGAHVTRAKVAHPIDDFDQIVADYNRSVDLNEGAAEGHEDAPEMLSNAARALIDLAKFVNEGRPIEEEKRDEEAIERAVAVATRACELEGAREEQFTVHLYALCEAHRMGVEKDLGKPYMQPLAPPVEGLTIQMPKAGGWRREKIGKDIRDLALNFTRQVEGDEDAVQITLNIYEFDARVDGPNWNKFGENVRTRFESSQDRMEVAASKEPVQLGAEPDDGKKKKKRKKKKLKGKDAAETWYFELTGTESGRQVRTGHWLWFTGEKAEISYWLRIKDWRRVPDLGDPDLVAFAESCYQPAEEDDPKKKGGR